MQLKFCVSLGFFTVKPYFNINCWWLNSPQIFGEKYWYICYSNTFTFSHDRFLSWRETLVDVELELYLKKLADLPPFS